MSRCGTPFYTEKVYGTIYRLFAKFHTVYGNFWSLEDFNKPYFGAFTTIYVGYMIINATKVTDCIKHSPFPLQMG